MAIPGLPRRGAVLLLGALAACSGGEPVDFDLRQFGGGFSTAEAAANPPARPAPDARGVISYPTYQVAVAQEGDTAASIAGRLGFDAAELAAYNGIAPEASLRRDEVVALPRPVPAAAPAPATTGAAAPAPAAPSAVTTSALAPSAGPAAAPIPFGTESAVPGGVEPIRHQVQRGETAYSVARLYGVPVRTVAEWNGLGPDLAVREGQFLLVPPAPAAAEAPTSEPGQGSPTPVPPSAAEPLPEEAPPPAAEARPEPVAAPQDLGAQATEARDGRLARPLEGAIIRAYAPGRNEGIDIGAPEGTEVRAAEAGTVAAITTNTDGIQIVVIKHADDLLTVYTNLDRLTVAKDDAVSRGQVIGRVRADDPSFLHFEVRRGMDSADPTEFLP